MRPAQHPPRGGTNARHARRAALGFGAGIGLLGGLIGLGGAEFRLPVLVRFFRYPLKRAILLNLAVSLVTVLTGAVVRLASGSGARLAADTLPVIGAMIAGGMLGALKGSAWLTAASEGNLRRVVQVLLSGIGGLLIAEAFIMGPSTGLVHSLPGRMVVGVIAGFFIGVVSSLLGVAGGELIIPVLVLVFGVGIKPAGTASLLISIPTILVSLRRHATTGDLFIRLDLRSLVAPMSIGSVVGATAGGLLVAYTPGATLKVLLGLLLLGSAVKMFSE